MFSSWGLHKTVVTLSVVRLWTLRSKSCFSPNSSSPSNSATRAVLSYRGKHGAARSLCSCELAQTHAWHPTADICTSSSSVPPSTSSIRTSFFHIDPHSHASDFWEGTNSARKVRSEHRIKPQSNLSSVPPVCPLSHHSLAQGGSAVGLFVWGLVRVQSVVWRYW